MHYSMSSICGNLHDDRKPNMVDLPAAAQAFSAGRNIIGMEQKIESPVLWDALSLADWHFLCQRWPGETDHGSL